MVNYRDASPNIDTLTFSEVQKARTAQALRAFYIYCRLVRIAESLTGTGVN